MSAVRLSGTASCGQVAIGRVHAVPQHETPIGDEHPDRLDRVQGHPVGARHDGQARLLGQAGHQPRDELAAIAPRTGAPGTGS